MFKKPTIRYYLADTVYIAVYLLLAFVVPLAAGSGATSQVLLYSLYGAIFALAPLASWATLRQLTPKANRQPLNKRHLTLATTAYAGLIVVMSALSTVLANQSGSLGLWAAVLSILLGILMPALPLLAFWLVLQKLSSKGLRDEQGRSIPFRAINALLNVTLVFTLVFAILTLYPLIFAVANATQGFIIGGPGLLAAFYMLPLLSILFASKAAILAIRASRSKNRKSLRLILSVTYLVLAIAVAVPFVYTATNVLSAN
jgi:hypothetical protein